MGVMETWASVRRFACVDKIVAIKSCMLAYESGDSLSPMKMELYISFSIFVSMFV